MTAKEFVLYGSDSLPFAFETKGTVLLALGLTSITKISSFLIAN